MFYWGNFIFYFYFCKKYWVPDPEPCAWKLSTLHWCLVALNGYSAKTFPDTDLLWKIRLYVWPCGCLSFLYILLAYPRTIRSLGDTFWRLSRCQHASPFACTISCIHLEFCILFTVTIGCVFSKLSLPFLSRRDGQETCPLLSIAISSLSQTR